MCAARSRASGPFETKCPRVGWAHPYVRASTPPYETIVKVQCVTLSLGALRTKTVDAVPLTSDLYTGVVTDEYEKIIPLDVKRNLIYIERETGVTLEGRRKRRDSG